MEVSFEAGYFGPGSPPVADRGGRTRFAWLDGEWKYDFDLNYVPARVTRPRPELEPAEIQQQRKG
jgi:hypothetical protein